MCLHTTGSDEEMDVKRRENLSEAASKTLFGSVFDLSDLVRFFGKRPPPSFWITGIGLVAVKNHKLKGTDEFHKYL